MLGKATVIAALIAAVSAQATAPQYGQCGGIGWSGATACTSGWSCKYSNDYYSQCLPGAASSTAAPQPPSTPAPPPVTPKPPTPTTPGANPPPPPAPTATAGPTGSTLLAGNLWIRAVEAPNFHKYLQSQVSGQPGPAILGDYTTAAQFQLVNGQLQQQLGNGAVLYLNANTTTVGGLTYLSTTFTTTPGSVGTFAWQGDGLTWTATGIQRQNIGAWLACGDSVKPGAFINLGAYAYMTPAGCADETLNYYNGATAVP